MDHYLRSNFLKIVFNINIGFRNMNYFTLTSLLLLGFEKQAFDVNIKILNLTIRFLFDSDRFEKPLIWLYREIWVVSDVSHIFEFIIIWYSIILFFFLLAFIITPYKFQKSWYILFSPLIFKIVTFSIIGTWLCSALCCPNFCVYFSFALFLNGFICYCLFVKCV